MTDLIKTFTFSRINLTLCEFCWCLSKQAFLHSPLLLL